MKVVLLSSHIYQLKRNYLHIYFGLLNGKKEEKCSQLYNNIDYCTY